MIKQCKERQYLYTIFVGKEKGKMEKVKIKVS